MRTNGLSLLAALLQPAPHQADSPNENRIGLQQLAGITAQVDENSKVLMVSVKKMGLGITVAQDLAAKLESPSVFNNRVDVS